MKRTYVVFVDKRSLTFVIILNSISPWSHFQDLRNWGRTFSISMMSCPPSFEFDSRSDGAWDGSPLVSIRVANGPTPPKNWGQDRPNYHHGGRIFGRGSDRFVFLRDSRSVQMVAKRFETLPLITESGIGAAS